MSTAATGPPEPTRGNARQWICRQVVVTASAATMETRAEATSAATRDALKRLGDDPREGDDREDEPPR